MATHRCSNCKKTLNVDLFETNEKTQQIYKTCSRCRAKQKAKTGKQENEIKDTLTKYDERINELERDNDCLNSHIDHLEAVQQNMTSENKELLNQINELKNTVDELQKNQKIKLENDMFHKVVQESKQGLKKKAKV
jgi:methylphosphotriester-DNA--protein-cysteine methyltransferase